MLHSCRTFISTINNINIKSFVVFLMIIIIGEYALLSIEPLCQNLIQKILFSIAFFILSTFFWWVGLRTLCNLSLFPKQAIHVVQFLTASAIVFLIGIFYAVFIISLIVFFKHESIVAYSNFILQSVIYSSISFASYFNGHKLLDVAMGSAASLKGSISSARPILPLIILIALSIGVLSAFELNIQNYLILKIFYPVVLTATEIIFLFALRSKTQHQEM